MKKHWCKKHRCFVGSKKFNERCRLYRCKWMFYKGKQVFPERGER